MAAETRLARGLTPGRKGAAATALTPSQHGGEEVKGRSEVVEAGWKCCAVLCVLVTGEHFKARELC